MPLKACQHFGVTMQGVNGEANAVDWANAFWGEAEKGPEVLINRMKSGAKTCEELRAFWKERASIEEDYHKRLSKLAKFPLGSYEPAGQLKTALNCISIEIASQAAIQADVLNKLRKEAEGPVIERCKAATAWMKGPMSAIEKSLTKKQRDDAYVSKSRDKFEEYAHAVNSYTAQSALSQGKELEKIFLKLEKAKQCVGPQEQEYQMLVKAQAEGVRKWIADWRAFCDQCQDMEEDRLEFIKFNAWAYANAVSTSCVFLDDSCERLRTALELIECESELHLWSAAVGTGREVPEPEIFIDYAKGESQPEYRKKGRLAAFTRNSTRTAMVSLPSEASLYSSAGVKDQVTKTDNSTIAQTFTSPAKQNPIALHAEPSRKDASLMKNQFTEEFPDQESHNDTQSEVESVRSRSTARFEDSQSVPVSTTSQSVDALSAALAALRNLPANNVPEISHKASMPTEIVPVEQANHHQRSTSPSKKSRSRANTQDFPAIHQELSLSSSSIPNTASRRDDIRQQTFTAQENEQRSPSKHAHTPMYPENMLYAGPSAILMSPPQTAPHSPIPVEKILSQYGQSLPEERYVEQNHFQRAQASSQRTEIRDSHLSDQRMVSQGYAGVGTRSRPASPSHGPGARSASPRPGGIFIHSQVTMPSNIQQLSSTDPSSDMRKGANLGSHSINQTSQALPNVQTGLSSLNDNYLVDKQSRNLSHLNTSSPALLRSSSPLGIRLTSSGEVQEDQLAEQFKAQRLHIQQSQPVQVMQQNLSTNSQHLKYQQPQELQQTQSQLRQQFSPQPNVQPYHNHYPDSMMPSDNQQFLYKGADSSIDHNDSSTQFMNNMQDMRSNFASPIPNGWVTAENQIKAQQRSTVAPSLDFPPIQIGRPTSVKPEPAFRMRAIFNYEAQLDYEFDFYDGDIILVYQTPPDGWWKGELEDASRRIPGKDTFPSNFCEIIP